MKKLFYMLTLMPLLFTLSCNKPPTITSLKIGYTDYCFDQTVAMVLKGIFDKQENLDVGLYKLPDSTLFRTLAEGEIDVMISAWLPNTHQHFLEMYPYDISKHSMICDSLGIYLAMPRYTEITEINELPSVGHLLNYTILIPESSNAIFHLGNSIISDYGLSRFRLQEMPWDAIISFVEESIKTNSLFAFVAMRPHWIFDRHDLIALNDTRHSFGQFEQAFICANIEFLNKMPIIGNFLGNVLFELHDIEVLMELNQMLGTEPADNAVRWINRNTQKVNRWLMDV